MKKALLLYLTIILDAYGLLAQCPTPVHPDYPALMALYNSTNGPGWHNNQGWAGGAAGTDCDPCKWYGVRCGFYSGRVVIVDLPGNNLKGVLPVEIAQLTEMFTLRLSNNELTGTIPSVVWQMSNLSMLVLDSNRLSDTISSSISDMQRLRILDLSNNDLYGTIPEEIALIPYLTEINLSRNRLSGSIPDGLCKPLLTLKLNLSQNQLSGKLPPDLGTPYCLTDLNVSHNQLSGTIADIFSEYSYIIEFNLSNNRFTGPLPEGFIDTTPVSPVRQLYLHNNDFSGCVPNGWRRFCSLGFSNDPAKNGYNLTGNPKLAWQGDISLFCAGQPQIGAPCDDGDSTTINDRIRADCTCQGDSLVTTNEPLVQFTRLYPNPANTFLFVRGELPQQMLFFTLSGQLWQQLQPISPTLSLANYPAGMYIVQLHYPDRVEIERLIIHK